VRAGNAHFFQTAGCGSWETLAKFASGAAIGPLSFTLDVLNVIKITGRGNSLLGARPEAIRARPEAYFCNEAPPMSEISQTEDRRPIDPLTGSAYASDIRRL
jgi:hypothetical protein